MNAIATIKPAHPPCDKGTITVTISDLRPAVVKAVAIVERRNTIPILGCLHITPKRDKLEIRATNIDTWLTITCPAQCAAGEPFTIDARLMDMILRGADRADSVRIERQDNILILRHGTATIRLQELCPPSDFPVEPEVDDMASCEVPETVLAKLIDNIKWAISTEETRYYLNGIYLHARDGMLAGCATDGHRLALYQTATDYPLEALIFPRYSVAALRNLLTAGGNHAVRIAAALDKPQMRIEGEGWTATVKCIDGKFPDYTRVIPGRDKARGHAVINRHTMRIFPSFRKMSHCREGIKLDLGKGIATCSSVSLGLTVEAPVEASGDFSVGFNQRYLSEIVSLFGTVKLEAASSGDAAHILTEDPDLTVVLMPMRV